jgi:hypothetical protein
MAVSIRWGRVVTNTDVFALRQSDLNGFLFAEVGVETNGMALSVLSAFARLGMDPWQEAGRLAMLPRAAAVDGLARTIVSMQASPWSLPDATAIAARLVSLLPQGGGPPVRPAPARAGPAMDRRWVFVLVLLGTVLAGLALNLAGAPGEAPGGGAARWASGQPGSTAMPPTGSASAAD